MPRAVLFDIDGTLLDTHELIFQAFEYTLKKHFLRPVPRSELATHMGKSGILTYQSIAPSSDAAVLFETHRAFQKEHTELAKIYPNVQSTLRILHSSGFKLGAVTTRSKESSIGTLEVVGIKKFLDVVISLEDVTNTKPDPEPVLKALSLLSASPDESFMVGDTHVDVEAGKGAGVRTIGVTYGMQCVEVKKSNPDYTVDDISEIVDIINAR